MAAAAPIEINNKSVLGEQRRDLLKKDRRKVSEGYPAEPFTDVAAIRRYLSQEMIDCLICGRCLKSLSSHLAKIHRISSDDYKARFGLPFRAGLTSAQTTSKLRDVRNRDSEKVLKERADRNRETANARVEAARNQRKSLIKTLISSQNLVSINAGVRKHRDATGAGPKVRYFLDDARLVVEKLEAGAFLKDVITMAPSTLRKLLATDPALRERYRAASCVARNERNRTFRRASP